MGAGLFPDLSTEEDKKNAQAGGRHFKQSQERRPWLVKIDGIPMDQVVSGLQKMIRRGLEKEAIIFGRAIFLQGFEKYLAKRLVVIAYEDIGIGNPELTQLIYTTVQAWLWINETAKQKAFGPLGMAIMLMCRSEKCRDASNSGWWARLELEKGEKSDYSLRKILDHYGDIIIDGHTSAGRKKIKEDRPDDTEAGKWEYFFTKGAR